MEHNFYPHGEISFSLFRFRWRKEEAASITHALTQEGMHFIFTAKSLHAVSESFTFSEVVHQILKRQRRIDESLMTVYSSKGFCSLSFLLFFQLPFALFLDAEQDLKKIS